jgi:glycosyltransferase involved in cell wall biosynthesis
MATETMSARPVDAELAAAFAAGLDAGGAGLEAEELLRAWLPDDSDGGIIAGAWMSWWSGRPLEAWQAVRSLPPEQVGSSLLVKIGRSLRTNGELEAAKDALAAAATIDPDHERAQRLAAVTRGVWVHASGRWHATPPLVIQGQAVPGRVMHIVTRSRPYWQSGYTIRTRSLTKGQQALGLDPHVVTQFGFPLTAGVDGAPSSQLVDGVPHHHLLPADGQVVLPADEQMTASLHGMASIVHELRPAVLHAASDYRNALLALRLGELYHLPVVYEVRGFPEEGMDVKSTDWYRSRQERDTECMIRADAVITLSEGMADEIASRGVDRSKVTLVPNGVDVDQFVPVARDHDLARRWGIGPDEVTLGYISTFSPYEGITYLLEAGSRLIARGLPVRIVLVGSGRWLPELERQAADLDLGDRVIFTGRVPHDEVLAYYGLIDIFVVPRTDERVSQLVTPLKPFEAMATGRAMIVSGVAALRGMVLEGITAEVFRPQDPEHLADVAEALVRDPRRRTALGTAARDWVVENRSWTKLARSYVDLYRRLGAV